MISKPSHFLTLFDRDQQIAEEKYRALFVRLVKFFEWRRCRPADDLAQETLRRGLERIAGGVEIQLDDAGFYFLGIARNVARETWKRRADAADGVDPDTTPSALPGPARVVESAILLDQCLESLSAEDRELFLRYHAGDRDRLQQELKIDANNLRVRVHRVTQRMRRVLESPLVGAK